LAGFIRNQRQWFAKAMLAVGVLTLCIAEAKAQTGNVGIGTTTPNSSALLEMLSTSKGILIPRMTSVQKLAITTPATGLLIYQTDSVSPTQPSTFYYYNGTIWLPFLSTFSGWLLNGNTGTTPTNNYLGTSDLQDMVIKTNATERLRFYSNGNVLLANSNNTAEELRFQEPSGSGSNYTAFKAGVQSADVTYTLPTADGTNGQFLKTNGSGVLSWGTAGAGGGLWQLGGGALSLVGIGSGNTSNGNYAISAGQSNSAGGSNSVAIGGLSNSAGGNYSVVSGGQSNNASGTNSVVGGGLSNTASQNYATVSGGQSNMASGSNSSVGGGLSNTASAQYSTISGGQSNQANGSGSSVGGGTSNTATGTNSTIAGGISNQTQGNYSTIAGGQSNTTASSANHATIGGGLSNQANGSYSFLGGGQSNLSGGASASYTTVGGGLSNTASASYSSVLGGQSNLASGVHSTVLGGLGNTASGQYAVALGGQSSTASGIHSLAFGNGASAASASMVVFNHPSSGQNTLFGIRTNTPSEALDVNGNVKFGGALMPNGLPGTSGYVLSSMGANTPPVWTNIAGLFWSLTGNSGTSPGTNFLGTTDAADLRIKTNGQDRVTVTSGGNTVINSTIGNAKLDVNGDFAMRYSGISLGNGNNNNVSVGSYSFVRITGPSAAFTVTGISNGVDGKVVTLYNATSASMTIANDNSSSTAANRIYTLNPNGDVTISGKGAVQLVYSSADSRWIAITPGTTNSFTPSVTVLYKTSDESVANSTLQNDDDLYFAMAANEVWQVEGYLYMTSGGTDGKVAFTIPTSASMNVGLHWSHNGNQSQEMDVDVLSTSGTASATIPIANNADNVIFFKGIVVNSSTAGNFQLQWAQSSTSASDPVKVKALSYMKATRVK